MISYNNRLLELEKVFNSFIFSNIMYIIPHPIKQIQNILIQDKNFILGAR
ncbi:hypothetical protein Arnit_1224 [Arcobacter nitrofigilis DSM 7299]|uniref:Uncharacterized protein n=1 Tax=Arcobacter nitrofigilis (strain ATCC 33309 / DSM 7299 / CCUG 15893 / LMG 7604 / NCTC 12251 / CI) TaxID=572480 RepID=D5V4H8_ARCNC|nr:hypothetical protein [Arcobacter nitrofigilis]ADG92883.1 hypothetical protein Arnit_1224 [Arcobacter nitrofigilis DSM 7299]